MRPCRLRFIWLGSALLCSVLGGCHDSSGAQLAPTTSVAPTQRTAPLQSAAPKSAAPTLASSAPVRVAAPDAAREGVAIADDSDAAAAARATSDKRDAQPSARPTADIAPVLVDAQGKPLAQTDERPTLASASFQQRVALVARAIITGEAEPAAAAFFPLLAYQQVKDVAKPERDYRFRLLANFQRDVLEYHRALGTAAADAKFDSVSVSEKDAKWMAPGSEGNRVGYFRVLRSHLRFTLPTGRTREFELTSMISWRGEWYVVHLHGFK